ncbi:hypothetical protein D3C81_1548460 [compost metagenome]
MVKQYRLHDAARTFAACHQGRTLADGVIDQRLYALTGPGIDQRAQRRVGLRGVCRTQAAHLLTQLGHELIGHRLFDDQPLGRHADLALVEVGTKGRRIDRSLQVGIGQDQERCLATQFEHCRLEVTRRQLPNDAPDMGRPGEIHPPHRRMGD